MFDNFYVTNGRGGHHTHRHNHNVKITEQRAPTDESIQLLNEMQDKAKENLIKSYIIDGNELNGAMDIYLEPMTLNYLVWTRFVLNGKEYITEDKIRSIDVKTNEEPLRLFYENISKAIAEKLMTENIANIQEIVRRNS